MRIGNRGLVPCVAEVSESLGLSMRKYGIFLSGLYTNATTTLYHLQQTYTKRHTCTKPTEQGQTWQRADEEPLKRP